MCNYDAYCMDCDLEFKCEPFCDGECPKCGRSYEFEYGIGSYYIVWL